MTTVLEELVSDAGRRHEGTESFVRDVVEREGASAVVAAVVRLLRARSPRAGEGILFLMTGEDLPALLSEIETDADLAAVLEEMLSGANVRERRMAVWALGGLPVRDRYGILERAAPKLLAENDLLSLSDVLVSVEPQDLIDRLVESDDWLLRWSLLPWTNQNVESPLAGDVRRRLAFDDHALVSAEAHQHLMIIDEWNAAQAGAQGYVFGLISNHGAAESFRAIAEEFVKSWPPEKTTYDLEELRAFILRSTSP